MDSTTNPAISNNPLTKYFRHPEIHLRLPTGGKFWKEGSLELPATGEIPVFPMTTKDEVTLRTPDALMNGSGVVDVIHSCCPNIKNAWDMPSVDVDAVLIAIRIASFGNNMDMNTVCPHCKEENNHSADLQNLLANITCPDYSKKLKYKELSIKLRPQRYFGANRTQMIYYQEQRLLQALEKAELEPDVRALEIYSSMGKLVEIGIENLTDSTEYIELEDGTIVNNSEHIKEFYANSSGDINKLVEKNLAELNEEAGTKPLTVACGECSQEYQTPLMFDFASFFGKGF